MAALLTSETGNTDKVVKYINECQEMGIKVLPPDVNWSDWNFTPDLTVPGRGGIRFGLGAVKNLGHSAVEAIQKARGDDGELPFSVSILREGGPQRAEPPHAGEPDQGRRHGLTGRRAGPAVRRHRARHGVRAAHTAGPAERPGRLVLPRRRPRPKSEEPLPSVPTGPCMRSSPAKRRCSAST